MRAIIKFEEFLNKGIVKKQTPNKSRASFLIKEAEQSYRNLLESLEKISINNTNANDYVKRCYDILMELIRAKLLLTGYGSIGQFAHEAEVAYFRRLGFPDNEVSFLNELRYFRNSVTYYGKILDSAYAKKVVEFVKKAYPKLKKHVT